MYSEIMLVLQMVIQVLLQDARLYNSWLDFSVRNNFPLLKWALKSIRKLLDTTVGCVPILYPPGYHVILVIVVHWQIELRRSIFCLPPLESHMVFYGTLKISSQGKDQVRLGLVHWLLCPKFMVSSVIQTYFLCLGGNSNEQSIT